MLKPGELVPNWKVEDASGAPHSLWEFRQRSHVILLGASDQKFLAAWKAEGKKREKALAWLNATLLYMGEDLTEQRPAILLIDRYGRLHQAMPVPAGSGIEEAFNRIENDLVYYEARHC